MHAIDYERALDPAHALRLAQAADTRFIGGGTNLLDLMKGGVERPLRLVDITRAGLADIAELPDGGLRIGALARNSDTGRSLPRIPPLRIGGRVQYEIADFDFELSASRYLKQDRVAALENETSGYTLVDLQVTYDINRWLPGTSIYLKGQNLTDEYARVHASFLKDKAPLPARSVAVGISGKF